MIFWRLVLHLNTRRRNPPPLSPFIKDFDLAQGEVLLEKEEVALVVLLCDAPPPLL